MNAEMRWAILIPRYLPEAIGGNTVYVRDFATRMAKRNHEVHIFTSTLREKLPSRVLVDGVVIHRVLVDSGDAGPLRFSTTRKLTDRFNRVDREVTFDVINPNAPFQVDYRRIRPELRVIHTAHAVATYEYFYLIWKIICTRDASWRNMTEVAAFAVKSPVSYVRERMALEQAEKIVVMSRYVQRCVQQYFPRIDESRIVVSKIGVDTSKFCPGGDNAPLKARMGLPDDCILFFTARRLVHRMGLENLIDAFVRCKAMNPGEALYLFIAGDGPLRRRIEARTETLKVQDSVRLLGLVSDEDLIMYYRTADAFVLPSEQLEGFGIVSVEAMACNLPVIATPVGANKEVLAGCCDELIAESAEPASIAARMDLFVKGLDHYRGVDVASEVKRRFNWDLILSELEQGLRLSPGERTKRR